MALLLQPQEVEVYYLLPAIRSALAQALKRRGRTQADIAKLLGVTSAAVSQYASKKRGADNRIPDELAVLAEHAAKRITDQESMVRETQAILAEAKRTKLTCKLHEKVASDIPHGCSVCFPEARR